MFQADEGSWKTYLHMDVQESDFRSQNQEQRSYCDCTVW